MKLANILRFPLIADKIKKRRFDEKEARERHEAMVFFKTRLRKLASKQDDQRRAKDTDGGPAWKRRKTTMLGGAAEGERASTGTTGSDEGRGAETQWPETEEEVNRWVDSIFRA